MADTKISALTAAAAAAAANEFAINEAGTSKKVTGAQIQTLAWNAPIFAAGSASAGTKPKLSSGVLLTTPEAGAIEYESGIPYFTTAAGARGIISTIQESILTADFTLLNQTAEQSAFPTAQDVFTVDANTLYDVGGFYGVTTGATASALRVAFLLTTATMTYMMLHCHGSSTAINSGTATQFYTWINDVAVITITASGTQIGKAVRFSGRMAFGTAGTITPQVAFTADPTGTLLMKAGSFMSMRPLGSNTFTKNGNWA